MMGKRKKLRRVGFQGRSRGEQPSPDSTEDAGGKWLGPHCVSPAKTRGLGFYAFKPLSHCYRLPQWMCNFPGIFDCVWRPRTPAAHLRGGTETGAGSNAWDLDRWGDTLASPQGSHI